MNFVVGLGNPGIRYQLSRHNAGFLVLDQLALQYDIPIQQTLFDAHIGRGKIAGTPVLLAKPQSFMNLSGAAVGKLADYFRIDTASIIVLHDDLDLPFGTVRLKAGGGHAGHKGLISLIHHLGGTEFIRVRFGIGRPLRKSMVEGYVLERFSEDELKSLLLLTREAADAVTDILSGGIQAAMDKHHGKKISVEEV